MNRSIVFFLSRESYPTNASGARVQQHELNVTVMLAKTTYVLSPSKPRLQIAHLLSSFHLQMFLASISPRGWDPYHPKTPFHYLPSFRPYVKHSSKNADSSTQYRQHMLHRDTLLLLPFRLRVCVIIVHVLQYMAPAGSPRNLRYRPTPHDTSTAQVRHHYRFLRFLQ